VLLTGHEVSSVHAIVVLVVPFPRLLLLLVIPFPTLLLLLVVPFPTLLLLSVELSTIPVIALGM
jgi:hypothetical protein